MDIKIWSQNKIEVIKDDYSKKNIESKCGEKKTNQLSYKRIGQKTIESLGTTPLQFSIRRLSRSPVGAATWPGRKPKRLRWKDGKVDGDRHLSAGWQLDPWHLV